MKHNTDSGRPPVLDGITLLRVIAMFLVFYCHIPNTPLREMFSRLLLSPVQAGGIAVSIFFVISGFAMARNYPEESWSGFQRSGSIFWCRIAKFYPTALVVIFLSGLLAPFGGMREALTPGSVVLNVLLLQAWNMDLNFSGVTWFLSVLWFCYASFPFLNGWMNRRGITIPVLLATGFWCLALVSMFFENDIAGFFKALPPLRLYEFVLGMALCKSMRPHKNNHVDLLQCGVSIGSGILLAIFALCLQRKYGMSRIGGYIVWTPASLLLVNGFSNAPWCLEQAAVGRVVLFLGKIGFAFFMFHLVVLRFFHAILRMVRLDGNVFADIVAFSSAFIFSIFSGWIWTRFALPRLTEKCRKRNPFTPRCDVFRLECTILLAGVALAVVQFFFNRCLWTDSVRLSMNIAEKGFIDLLRPLKGHSSAPIGFLWVERALWTLFPGRDWSLKIVPLLSQILSLVLFSRTLRVVVRDGKVRLFALALYTMSVGPLYFSSEVKQYGVDALATTLVLWLVATNRDRWGLVRLCVAGLILVPFTNATFFLLPSAGLFSLASVPPDKRRTWYPVLFAGGAAWCVALAAYVLLFTDSSLKAHMLVYWTSVDPAFLFRQATLKQSLFTLARQTVGALAIFTGSLPTMAALAVLVPVEIVAMARSRTARRWLLLLVLPCLLHALASTMKQYPFAPRLLLHVYPSIVILAGLGLAPLLRRWSVIVGLLASLVVLAQTVTLLSVFPLQRHEIMSTVRKLDKVHAPGVPVVIDRYVACAWYFYNHDANAIPETLLSDARMRYDPETEQDTPLWSCPKCPIPGIADWWLLIGWSKQINIIPDIAVNRPLYWVFNSRNQKLNADGVSFQNHEEALIAHLSDVHGMHVVESIRDTGSTALHIKKQQ